MTDERRDRLAAAIEKAWDNQDSPQELARDILAAAADLLPDPAIVAAGEAVLALPPGSIVDRRTDDWSVYVPGVGRRSADTFPDAIAAALPAEEAER